ncbi:4-hydroxyphenylpyruvate dioxygenase [Alicyclobacillus ferrooxydans]|uniref:4-hydroxyphenylpyruvate dioxygenase n=1 Tax=Alicyclobacillus ferrooxydans TaxID=471514 RepID=A0A0P9D258_9BACL|nr:4-hydroxyphenylpyruvate dioxygenase [Alicyclobacillus ferrooxydans]KPV43614.1 4-hydroxyphenylpyruvate dioxygenase [Alicyclobacillus ferrooxydans]
MTDHLPLLGIDYTEFYVGNAKQFAYFLSKGCGFQVTAYAGMETGVRDRVSYVLEQGDIRLVVTGALSADHPIAEFVKLHGDGVKEIAFTVDDAELSYQAAVDHGAIAVSPVAVLEDQNGIVKKSVVGTYGDTVHAFIERGQYKGAFLPGYRKENNVFGGESKGLLAVDHTVGNVELGKMEYWVNYYEKALGFEQFVHFSDDDISTEYSALMSKVMQNGGGKIKFPINEPAVGKKKSQIQEYLEFYGGPGVQHIALKTNNIIRTVSEMKAAGVEFLSAPDSYYDELWDRIGEIDEDTKKLQELNVLVDRDEEGYLLQIFTRPLMDRPTVFIEVIQRKGSRGFGNGNFKALFEAIEKEQALRGNL